jgi:hypothetical protein
MTLGEEGTIAVPPHGMGRVSGGMRRRIFANSFCEVMEVYIGLCCPDMLRTFADKHLGDS